MKSLLTNVAARATTYLDELKDRRVWPSPEALAGLEAFNEALPEGSTSPGDVVALLDRVGTPATVASAGGRYFGFVIGGVLPAALGATWLAGAWDQNAFSGVSSPVGAAVEAVALRWLAEVLGLPVDCGGAFVTGATMANFSGLAAARQAVLERKGWDVVNSGLFGAPPVTVIVGEEVHPTVPKALGLLGMGRARIVRVPVDGQGRMRSDALPSMAGPTIVCIQAGNVNTGAFDPAQEICETAHAAGAWVHVDGAFGLWAAASPDRAYLTAGFAQADSWATDAHKWLNVPYDCGLVFLREPSFLRKNMQLKVSYLLGTEARDPYDYTPDSSRRARGIEVWAALRSLGRTGLADMIERHCRQAQRFADVLRKGGYEILNEVVLNQVLVSFGEPESTRRVIAALQAEGTCWCGGTEWHGRTAMRISVSSHATTDEDVECSLDAMFRAAARA